MKHCNKNTIRANSIISFPNSIRIGEFIATKSFFKKKKEYINIRNINSLSSDIQTICIDDEFIRILKWVD